MHLPTALTVVAAGSNAASDPVYAPSLGPDLPCPAHIRATVPGDNPFSTMAEVHRALAICPTVQSIQLRIGGYGCQCPDSRALPIHPDAITQYQSAPEVLELEGYAWGASVRSTLGTRLEAGLLPSFTFGGDSRDRYIALETWFDAWRWRFNNWAEWRRVASYTKEQLDIDNVALLLGALDTSRIHTLGIKALAFGKDDRPDLISLAKALPALNTLAIGGDVSTCRRKSRFYRYRHLAIYGFSDDDNSDDDEADCDLFPSFIGALAPSSLTNFTWVNGNDTSPETVAAILDRQGSSLEHLQLRTDEAFTSIRSFFSPDTLRALGAGAPRLASLTIDLDRKFSHWPIAHLGVIAENMPSLTDLTVYFPLSNAWEAYDWEEMAWGRSRWVSNGPAATPAATPDDGLDDGQDVLADELSDWVVEDVPVDDELENGGVFILDEKLDLRDDSQYQLLVDDEEEEQPANIFGGPRLPKYAVPRLTANAAAQLFRTLKAAKKGKPLNTVQFRVGDWARSYTRLPGDYREWLDGRRAWFRCSTLRDDGSPKAEGEAACVALRLTYPPDKVHGLAEWADISGGVVIDDDEAYKGEPWHGDEGALDGNGDPCHDPNWDSWWRWPSWRWW
ncbi:hypothetical protein F5X68DRAFT_212227 [Plectosphaerella plurivora]|uniref:Uncharacterized protein n=1 Tax=Plectosphaerella plurivora TaxID=936078 RepID=A0A9P8V4F0_9PEZI|nr:hypothetical protein F5X68DRAFT_212227 [Plectosphaerella plurivora]